MKMVFRWYGPGDSIPLTYIRQIPGMTGVVTAVYDIPVGEVWQTERILALRDACYAAGLEMEVIESVPVHEDIKLGRPSRDRYIENYAATIENLGRAGVRRLQCPVLLPRGTNGAGSALPASAGLG